MDAEKVRAGAAPDRVVRFRSPDGPRRLILNAIGAAFLRQASTLRIQPIDARSARRMIEQDDYEVGIGNRNFAGIISDVLEVNPIPSSTRGRIRLLPGDEAIVVSANGYIDPDRDYTRRQLDDMAATFSYMHVKVEA